MVRWYQKHGIGFVVEYSFAVEGPFLVCCFLALDLKLFWRFSILLLPSFFGGEEGSCSLEGYGPTESRALLERVFVITRCGYLGGFYAGLCGTWGVYHIFLLEVRGGRVVWKLAPLFPFILYSSTHYTSP